MRIIRKGHTGAAVEDVQMRLRRLGYELAPDGVFGDRTQAAVKAFRSKEGLPEGDTVDAATWSALVDATFALGDRMLYLRMPYFHGCDVLQLQQVLNNLGFSTGVLDGIFGARTEHALREFQSSVGLIDDGVAGPTSYDAVMRLRHAWEGKAPVSEGAVAHSGLSRAAEALEALDVCFFGLDETGREVATRAANVARATTPFSKVNSADVLSVVPADTTVMLGLGLEPSTDATGNPDVAFSEDIAFAQRLATALAALPAKRPRLCITLPAGPPEKFAGMPAERWRQHLAIGILDALCLTVGE